MTGNEQVKCRFCHTATADNYVPIYSENKITYWMYSNCYSTTMYGMSSEDDDE